MEGTCEATEYNACKEKEEEGDVEDKEDGGNAGRRKRMESTCGGAGWRVHVED